jgi:hypothetical protein
MPNHTRQALASTAAQHCAARSARDSEIVPSEAALEGVSADVRSGVRRAPLLPGLARSRPAPGHDEEPTRARVQHDVFCITWSALEDIRQNIGRSSAEHGGPRSQAS